jgi:hypothetical protein
MKEGLYCLGMISVIAIGLLIADRVYRINPILMQEGFQIGQAQQCGVDMTPCSFPMRCMNGYCRSQDQPKMYDRNPLPVVP